MRLTVSSLGRSEPARIVLGALHAPLSASSRRERNRPRPLSSTGLYGTPQARSWISGTFGRCAVSRISSAQAWRGAAMERSNAWPFVPAWTGISDAWFRSKGPTNARHHHRGRILRPGARPDGCCAQEWDRAAPSAGYRVRMTKPDRGGHGRACVSKIQLRNAARAHRRLGREVLFGARLLRPGRATSFLAGLVCSAAGSTAIASTSSSAPSRAKPEIATVVLAGRFWSDK